MYKVYIASILACVCMMYKFCLVLTSVDPLSWKGYFGPMAEKFQFKVVQDAAKHIRGEVEQTPLKVCTIQTYYFMIQCADSVSHHKHRNLSGCQKC